MKIELDNLSDDIYFEMVLTREKFEKLCRTQA